MNFLRIEKNERVRNRRNKRFNEKQLPQESIRLITFLEKDTSQRFTIDYSD